MKLLIKHKLLFKDGFNAAQFIIFASGGIAILLTQAESEQLRQYACLVGLIGQPYWLRSTYNSNQPGMYLLSIFYTYAWLKGLHLYWLAPFFVDLNFHLPFL